MNDNQAYTYRGGVKLPLTKRPDQFVVRAQRAELLPLGITDAERVSAGSSHMTTRADELEPMMARSRLLASTHHAYEVPATGDEFLITHRVLVSFKDALSAERITEVAGRYGLSQLEAYSDRDFLFQLTNQTGMNPVKLKVALTENEPLIAVADHDLNWQIKHCTIAIPTDPAYARQWLTHTLIGDLHVSIVSPSGRLATLHTRAGGGADNLIATYSSAMLGEPCAGAWRLRVADRDRVDTGKLNRWSLRILRQTTAPARKATARTAKASKNKILTGTAVARR